MPNAAASLAPCPHCGAVHPEDVLLCPKTGAVLPLAGRILDGKFRILGSLGRGGMGAVYRARNVLVAREVAIKLLHPEYARDPGTLERFRKEATAAGRIRNAHICDILDFGTSPVGPYIVMELLHGRSFADLIGQMGKVPPGLAVLIARQTLEGLAAAHDAGVIHRDLKPENIFLHEPTPGRLLVKIMDFGISKFTRDSTGGKTQQGVLMGTPEYMSPEQAAGAARADARTDVWAMGVVLYYAMSGRHPFLGPTLAATLANVTLREPPFLTEAAPEVPAALSEVVHGCLRKDPAERIATARDLSVRLAPFEQVPAVGPGASASAPAAVAADPGTGPGQAPAAGTAARNLLAQAQAASIAGALAQGEAATGRGAPVPDGGSSAPTVKGSGPAPEQSWILRAESVPEIRPESTLRTEGGRRWPLLVGVLLAAAAGVWALRVGVLGGADAGSGPESAVSTAGGTEVRGAADGGEDPGGPRPEGREGAGASDGSAGSGSAASGQVPGPPIPPAPGTGPGEAADGGDTGGGASTEPKVPKEGSKTPRPSRPDLRKVSKVDRFYVATGEPVPKLDLLQATRHCRRLSRRRFGRLRRWRLPTLKEIRRVDEAGKLPERTLYVTKSRRGDAYLYYNAFAKKGKQARSTDRARVMCVARR